MHVGGVEIFIVLVVVVLLFGSGKISALLGDLARSLKTFKKTMNKPDVEPPADSLYSRTSTILSSSWLKP